MHLCNCMLEWIYETARVYACSSTLIVRRRARFLSVCVGRSITVCTCMSIHFPMYNFVSVYAFLNYDWKDKCITITLKLQIVNVLVFVMLVSHCGEYMANGLTNAVRHEFVMIAK